VKIEMIMNASITTAAMKHSTTEDIKDSMASNHEARVQMLDQRERDILARRQAMKGEKESETSSTRIHAAALVDKTPLNELSEVNQLAVTMKRTHMQKLPKFDGKEKDWPSFITIYDSTSRDGRFSEPENVARLHEALSGEALNHVLPLLEFSCNASKVIEALRKAYGRPDRLIVKLTDDLIAFPKLLSATDVGIRKSLWKQKSSCRVFTH
jgi:Protein of unknown function (DUF1759)